MTKWLPFLAGVLVVVALVAAWSRLFHDPAMPASRWLLDVMQVQDELASQPAQDGEGRILLVGGSSALFGLDGVTLSRLSGRPVHNLGSHGGLSMDFHLDRVERLARPGDIVLVAPELRYFEDAGLSLFEQEQAAIWMTQDYAARRPLDAFETAWRTPAELLFDVALNRLREGPQAETGRDPAGSMARWRAARAGEIERPYPPYTVEWLDESGGVLVAGPPVRGGLRTREIAERYGPGVERVTPPLVKRLQAASRRLDRRGASLHLLLPPLMEGPEGRFNTLDGSAERLAANLAQFEATGVDVICSLEASLFEPERFYDTQYHLNAWGGTERAIRLAACLDAEGLVTSVANAASGVPATTPWRDMLEARAAQADLQDWERVLLDMLRIEAALEAYRERHGQYPESQRWDGPNSNWGRSGENWIPALVPAHLPVMPQSLPDTAVGFLYWSNGADFKLVYQDGRIARPVSELAPNFLDPQRDNALGIWTSDRLENW